MKITNGGVINRAILGLLVLFLTALIMPSSITAAGAAKWGTSEREALDALTLEGDVEEGEEVYEICSACHPFYTGKQKLIDTAGRVEKYYKKYNLDKK